MHITVNLREQVRPEGYSMPTCICAVYGRITVPYAVEALRLSLYSTGTGTGTVSTVSIP
jgi:hypothetical protein